MKKYVQKVLALLMTICLMFPFTLLASAGDTVVQEEVAEFPLATDMIVMEGERIVSSLSGEDNKIENVELYTTERDSLEFVLRLSLKDELKEMCSSFTVTLDDEGDIADQVSERVVGKNAYTEYVGLKLDKAYAITISLTYDLTFEGDYVPSSYIGAILCGVDVDGTLVVDLRYTVNETTSKSRNTPGFAESSASGSVFSSNNDTADKAVIIEDYFGCNFSGMITTTSDLDYFTFLAPCTGYADIILATPGMTYKFGVTNFSGVFSWQTSSSGSPLYKRLAITKGATYFICVSGTGSNYTNVYNYTLNVNVTATKAWYSQIHAGFDDPECESDGYYFWNTKYLDTIYLSADTSKPFMVDTLTKTSSTDQMYVGCFMASAAMVLRNMNAKMTGYDYRTKITGELIADPYTVMLASNNLTGNELSIVDGKRVLATPSSPMNMNRTAVATAFGKTMTRQEISGTDSAKATIIANKLAENPEGIIMHLTNGHFVVCGGDTNSSDLNSRFIIYDSGSAYSSTGNGVAFNTREYSLSQVNILYWYD